MENPKIVALKAFRLFFRPLAQMLLRAGVNWREVAELGKATFVEVATREFGIRGRPTNISRVAGSCPAGGRTRITSTPMASRGFCAAMEATRLSSPYATATAATCPARRF